MLKYALAETVIYDRLKCPPTAVTGELEHVSLGHFFFLPRITFRGNGTSNVRFILAQSSCLALSFN